MRGNLIYKLYNSDRSIALAGNCDIDVWLGRMREYLSPSLDNFSDEERTKILLLILREHAEKTRDNSEEFLLSSLVERISVNAKKGIVTL